MNIFKRLFVLPRYMKARAITKKANKALAKGDYTTAKTLYLSLEDMKMVNFMIYHNIASIYFQEHDWQRAEEYFKKSIMLHPKSAVSYSTLSEVYLRRRLWKDAEAAIEKALASDPMNYFLAKRKDKIFDTQWRVKHVDSLEMSEEGVRFLAQASYDDALNRFERAIVLDDYNATAHYCIATIYSRNKEYKKAVHAVSRALEIEPSNREYSAMLSMIQQQVRQETTKEE